MYLELDPGAQVLITKVSLRMGEHIVYKFVHVRDCILQPRVVYNLCYNESKRIVSIDFNTLLLKYPSI